MSSFFSKCSKFDGDLENGAKNWENVLLCCIIAFDTAPADSKYNKENTCDRLSMF